jgi:hypothetical protein
MKYELGPLTFHDPLKLSDLYIDPNTGVITFLNDPNTWGAVDVPVRADDGFLCCGWQTFTFTVERGHTVNQNMWLDYGQAREPDTSGPESGPAQGPDMSGPFSEFFQTAWSNHGLESMSGPTIGSYGGPASDTPASLWRDLAESQWGELLAVAFYGPDSKTRDMAWDDLFSQLKEHDTAARSDQILGLEMFLAKLRRFNAVGYDFNYTLDFNAEDILLVEWLESLPGLSNYGKGNPAAGSGAYGGDMSEPLNGAQIFDPDEICFANLIAAGPADYHGNPIEEGALAIDLDKLRMTDIFKS